MSIDAQVAVEQQEVEVKEVASTEKTLTISGVLKHLEDGLTREAIGTMYGLEKWEVNELFKHPKLKNRKAKKVKKVTFTLVDDTEGESLTN